MRWRRALAILCAVIVGAWLAFDGARALIVGDYVTPSSGRFAGRLGPWSQLFTAIGVDPRSTGVKAIHVVVGGLILLGTLALLVREKRAKPAFLITCALGLWYLPFGTLLLGVAIVLAAATPSAAPRSTPHPPP